MLPVLPTPSDNTAGAKKMTKTNVVVIMDAGMSTKFY